jgi:acetyltransferase-like isoleucine patch superfamily enzyme
MSDIYLQITETPAVVTLSAPVISAALSSTVTVANVVSVNVVTMPAINVTAAVSGGLSNAELRASAVSVAVTTMPAISISSVTVSNFPASQTVAGTITIGSCVTHGVNVANSVTISSLPAISGTVTIGNTVTISGTVTANPTGTQTIAGTVTANVPNLLISETSVATGIQIFAYNEEYGQSFALRGSTSDVGALRVQPISLPAISGTVTANLGSAIPTGTNRIGVVTIGGGTVTIGAGTALMGSVTLGTGTAQIGSVTASISGTVPISISSVTIGNSVTISSLPAISGTVTATAKPEQLNWYTLKVTGPDAKYSGYYAFVIRADGGSWWSPASGTYYDYVGNTFNPLRIKYGLDNTGNGRWSGNRWALFNDDLPIFWDDNGAVDIRNCDFHEQDNWVVEPCSGIPTSVIYSTPIQISNLPSVQTISGTVTVSSLPVQLSTTTIGGTARLNVTLSSATTIGATAPSYGNLYGGSDGTNLRAISVDTSGRTVVTGSVSVASTTVTISAQPSGALTTRFGSVVTANSAGITTAVTNTSRKYLLAQNISTGTVTIGIGFSPTTTQGIQLTAGAGLTFDSFVPTGAVYWLGATTGAAYTILEG